MRTVQLLVAGCFVLGCAAPSTVRADDSLGYSDEALGAEQFKIPLPRSIANELDEDEEIALHVCEGHPPRGWLRDYTCDNELDFVGYGCSQFASRLKNKHKGYEASLLLLILRRSCLRGHPGGCDNYFGLSSYAGTTEIERARSLAATKCDQARMGPGYRLVACKGIDVTGQICDQAASSLYPRGSNGLSPEEQKQQATLFGIACQRYSVVHACEEWKGYASKEAHEAAERRGTLDAQNAQITADHERERRKLEETRVPEKSSLEILSDALAGRAPAASAPVPSAVPASAACSSCGSTCSGLNAGCSGGSQRSCYQAAACLCRCNLAAGGCGSSIPVLQQCITQNEASAAALVSGTAVNPAALPPQNSPAQQRPQAIDAAPCGRQYGVPCVSQGAR